MRRVRLTPDAVDALCADATALGVVQRARMPRTVLEHSLRCSLAAWWLCKVVIHG